MELNEIYKCPICGNIVEITHIGGGELVCCGKPMELLEEKLEHQEFSMEKHVPILEKTKCGIKVKIASVLHPMDYNHFIEFIEVVTNDNKIGRKYLKPGDLPEAEFNIEFEKVSYVREYCNLHGLWRN